MNSPKAAERARFVEPLLHELVALELAFSDVQDQGLDAHTVEALQDFWADPDFAELADRLRLVPTGGWEDIEAQCTRLASGRDRHESYEPWIAVADKCDALASSNRMAGAIAALYAMAAWEGAIGELLFHNAGAGHDPGWHVFPLVLGRNLLGVDAVWNAAVVVDLAVEVIASCIELPRMPNAQHALDTYREVASQIHRRRADALATLAWDLVKVGCRPEQPNLRSEIAALLWTVGDVPHATLLGSGASADYVPTLGVMQALVDYSYQRTIDDPFLQRLWQRLFAADVLSLRDYPVLHNLITHFWRWTDLQRLDQESDYALSMIYTSCIIAHFSGAMNDQQRSVLGHVLATFGSYLEVEAPAFLIRIAGLFNVVGGTDEPPETLWRVLAGYAAAQLELAGRDGARQDATDLRMDIPFFYLDAENEDGFVLAQKYLEAYRAAGLWYWLRAVPPGRTGIPQRLIDEEDDLLRSFRGAHFTLFPKPMSYRRYTPPPGLVQHLEFLEQEGRGRQPHDLYQEQLHPDVVRGDLAELERRFESLWQQMDANVPGYAAKRRQPATPLEEFLPLLRLA